MSWFGMYNPDTIERDSRFLQKALTYIIAGTAALIMIEQSAIKYKGIVSYWDGEVLDKADVNKNRKIDDGAEFEDIRRTLLPRRQAQVRSLDDLNLGEKRRYVEAKEKESLPEPSHK